MLGRRNGSKWPAALVVLMVISATPLSACSANPSTDGSVSNPGLEALLVDARANDAGEEEIAIIEAALAEGRDVTFEEYKESANRSMDCLRGLGFDVVNYQETQKADWIQISYGYGGVSEEEFEALDSAAQACERDHIMWTQFAYQLNLSDIDPDAVYEQYRPAMIECVNRNGGSLSQEATITEVIDADFELTANDPSLESCVVTTGLDEVL